MDTILSNTIPIFTNIHQYNVLPFWYDWDKLSYFCNVENEEIFMKCIKNILLNQTDYQIKLRNVVNNRDLFDWRTFAPFETYMYMLQYYLWPHLNSTFTVRYNALTTTPSIELFNKFKQS